LVDLDPLGVGVVEIDPSDVAQMNGPIAATKAPLARFSAANSVSFLTAFSPRIKHDRDDPGDFLLMQKLGFHPLLSG
jgi:hypothetical protein